MPTSSSPLEYLVVFTIVFAAGVLWNIATDHYVEKVRAEQRHA